MLSFQTTICVLATMLFSIRAISATDLQFYNQNNCAGAIIDICSNFPEGECCGSLTQLWTSVQAVNTPPCFSAKTPAKTTGFSAQNQQPCAVLLGSGIPCYSAGSQIISGATYQLLAVCDAAVKERRDGASKDEKCLEPDLIGYIEDGVSYQLYKNGTTYAALMASPAANDESAVGQFIQQNAERVVQL